MTNHLNTIQSEESERCKPQKTKQNISTSKAQDSSNDSMTTQETIKHTTQKTTQKHTQKATQEMTDAQTNPTTDKATDKITDNIKLSERFRKFMPVVVDVETAGFNAATDALLEIACIPILIDDKGNFVPGEPLNAHIEPFEGANLEQSALEFTGIDPSNPMRKVLAEEEKPALRRIFKAIKTVRKEQGCLKCILVGHNAHFDLAFLNAACQRTNNSNHNPFHKFSVLDTVSLAALAFGQTVLAKACQVAGIEFEGSQAHSALYDTQKTAELFCYILNQYDMLAPVTHSTHSNQSATDTQNTTDTANDDTLSKEN